QDRKLLGGIVSNRRGINVHLLWCCRTPDGNAEAVVITYGGVGYLHGVVAHQHQARARLLCIVASQRHRRKVGLRDTIDPHSHPGSILNEKIMRTELTVRFSISADCADSGFSARAVKDATREMKL